MLERGNNSWAARMLRHFAGLRMSFVLVIAIAFLLLLAGAGSGDVHLPGNQQGYEPVQPIAYSHRLHAGELGIGCEYCHSGASRSRHAGIPAAQTCMNCHKFVTAPFGAIRAEDELAKKEGRAPRRIVSPEIQKIYDALALNEKLERDPARQPRPIAWNKVHNLADFVYFDHRPHVNAGVACQTCHGPVETMERVRQISSLSMGTCVNCHRDVNRAGLDGKGNLTSAAAPAARGDKPATHQVNASIDCATCHY